MVHRILDFRFWINLQSKTQIGEQGTVRYLFRLSSLLPLALLPTQTTENMGNAPAHQVLYPNQS